MQTETEGKGEIVQVNIGRKRTEKLIEYLNGLSEIKYKGVVKFDFAGGKQSKGKIHPSENTKENRLYGGVGIAIECKYNNKITYIHPRAALTVDDLAGATLTTESNCKSEWGLLAGSLILATIIDKDDKPLKYALFKFDNLVKLGCVEHRRDKETNVRVHLNKVAMSLVPFCGRDRPVGLVFSGGNLDAVAAIIEMVKQC